MQTKGTPANPLLIGVYHLLCFACIRKKQEVLHYNRCEYCVLVNYLELPNNQAENERRNPTLCTGIAAFYCLLCLVSSCYL